MTKKLLLLLLVFPAWVFSQNHATADALLVQLQGMKEDTLKVNQLLKITEHYTEIDTAKALFYGQKAVQLSKKLAWNNGVAKANFHLGSLYYIKLVYKKALTYFNESLKTSDSKRRSKSLQNIGEVYLKIGDFPKALNYCFKSLKIDEAIGNKKGVAKIYANMGSVYYGIQNYSKALEYYDKAAKMYEEAGNFTDLAIVNRNKAGVYNSLKQPEKALLYYEKATVLCEKSKNKALQARILSDISLVYYNSEDYDKAIEKCYLSLKAIPKDKEDKQTIGFSYGVLGDSYIEKAKGNGHKMMYLDSALFNLNKAVKIHQQLRSNRDLAYDFSSITQANKLKGDFKSAIASYETAMVYEDSVFNFDNKETIKNLEDKRAIELRDKEIKINNLKLDAKEKQKWFLISGLALLGIIGGLLYFQSNNRRKINTKLYLLNTNLEEKNIELDQANKIKARFFSILNHDLRSPVYNLIHFLHLQKENPELLDDEMRISIEEKTMTSAENLLTSMEDMLLWSKSQMENFEPEPKNVSINSLFDDTRKHFESEEKVKITFENSIGIQIYCDENYLKTIIRNLTGNAIKALDTVENPTIIWKAWRENDQIVLSITDNGLGATQDQFKALYDENEVVGIKTGLGLHLIRDLAKAIRCKIEVNSKENIGTTFTLVFP